MKKLLLVLLAMMLPLCVALAEDDETWVDTSNVPELPGGTLTGVPRLLYLQSDLSVYAAPDSKSLRGAEGRARVSTNGWIQVFGSEGDWILVQYDITDTHNRIGYIKKDALPDGTVVPELNLTRMPAVVHYDVEVTDDPLVSRDALARLTENTKVICLGTLGEWTYIEAEEDGVRLRGFVPTVCLYATVTDLSEARRAMTGSWRLYSGSSINASRITFNEDGTMTGKSQLESGCEVEWSGAWSIDFYDTRARPLLE